MKSVAIVGFAVQTRDLANAEPPEVEVWGMNVNHVFLKRWDRWFQLHPQSWHKGKYGRDDAHLAFLRTCNVPLYMNDPMPDIPTATPFPYGAIAEDLGRDYLTSTGAHAIALAIHECYDEIKVYGINVATDLEYVEQRPCIEWLLGIAQGRGIKVTLPAYTMLLAGRRYPLGERSEIDFIQERLRQSRSDFMAGWAKVYQLLGAYKALVQAGQNPHGVKIQFVREMMRLQKDRGEFEAAKFMLRRLGGTDLSSAELPDIDIPAELLEVDGIAETMPNVLDMPMAMGVRVR